MNKHTPGPWHVDTEAYGDEWWFGGNGQGQFIIRAGEKDIACFGLWRKENVETVEHEANARLIAAAPELLAACRKATNIVEVVGHCAGEWTREHQALAQQYAREARAAIAKAEGKEVMEEKK